MHMAADFELAGDFASPGQAVHMLAPIDAENVFGGHPSHLVVSAFKNVPGLHTSACTTIAVHDAAPKPLVVPAAQGVQVAEPIAPIVAEDVRGGQGKQSLEPAATAKYPTPHWKLLGFAMQSSTESEPLLETDFSSLMSGQRKQPSGLLCPAEGPYVPGGQNSQVWLDRA